MPRRPFGRSRPLPPGLTLEPGERVLATSDVDDGGGPGAVAVATTAALVLLRDRERQWSRRWHDLDSGTWDGDGRVLHLRDVQGWRVSLRLREDARLALPVAVRDRVQASVVATREASVGTGPTVRVSVRQVQGRPDAGRLVVQEVPPAAEQRTPGLRALVLSRRRELEDAVGLPHAPQDGPEAG